MARLSDLGIDFDHWCFACGRANPIGLHLDYDVSRGRAETRFVPRREHTGYDGLVHGGIVTALLDETMGWAIFHQGIWGVTARIAVVFRQPVTVDSELRITGAVTKETRRAIETHGEVRGPAGELLAEADATFLVMPEERRKELERRYSRIDEAFAKVRAAVEKEETRA
ncbi:MAG TPA: PaaI family thioesterase [Candidatus Limnocylindria bacterium]